MVSGFRQAMVNSLNVKSRVENIAKDGETLINTHGENDC